MLQRQCFIGWSSKALARETDKREHFNCDSFNDLSEFKDHLKYWLGEATPAAWVRDIGVEKMRHTYRGSEDFGKPVNGVRGTDFHLLATVSGKDPRSLLTILKIVEPLFLALYPSVVPKFRGSNYRRTLLQFYRRTGLALCCGYRGCSVSGGENLEAAHVLPAQRGGTDNIENLVFLCNKHHGHQEGLALAEQKKLIKAVYRAHTKLA